MSRIKGARRSFVSYTSTAGVAKPSVDSHARQWRATSWALSAAAMVGLSATRSQAANAIPLWSPASGTSGLADWGTAANWTGPSSVPSGAFDARFDSTTYNYTPNLNAAFAIGDLIFGDGPTATAPITISGSAGTDTLQLNADNQAGQTVAVASTKYNGAVDPTMIIMNANAGAVTINTNLILNGGNDAIANNSVNLLTINGNLALDHSFVTAGSGNITINGNVSAGFSVDAAGSGTLTLNGTNTNSASDYVENGTVLIGNNAAMGTTTINLGYTAGTNSATLLTNGAYTVANNIAVGHTTNTTGTLTLGGATANASTFSGTVTLLDGLTINQVANGSVTFGKAITGAYPVTVAGAGTVIYTAVNTYSGGTSINNGTLQLSGNGSVAGQIAVGSAGTFDVSPFASYTLASNQPLTGTGTVLGNLTVPGTAIVSPGVSSLSNVGSLKFGTVSSQASLTLNAGSVFNASLGSPASSLAGLGSSYAGNISVNGNLTLPSSGYININLTDNAGANGQGTAGAGYYELMSYSGTLNNFNANDFNIISRPAALNGDVVTFINQNNQIDVEFTVPSASLTYTGAGGGVWDNSTVSWANGTTATTYADPDPVYFGDNSALAGNSLITNTTVNIQNAGVQPTGVVFNNSSVTYTITTGGNVGIAGSTGITKNGTGLVNLAGSNSFTGAVLINAGAINVSNSSALGNSIGVTVASGAALQLQGGITTGSATPLTISGSGLTASPAGALDNISGNNTYSGAIALGNASGATITSTSGTLTLAAGINNAGHPLTINGAGNVTLSNAGISGSGALTYSGTGTLALPAGSTYTGNTTIASGLVNIADGTALGSATATISFTGNATLQAGGNANLVHPIAISNGVNATFDTNGNNMTIGAVTGGATSSLTKINSGILTLTGASNYSGATIVTGGTLQLTPALTTSVAPQLHVDASNLNGLSGNVTVGNLGTQGGSFSGTIGGLSTINGRSAFTFGGLGSGQYLLSSNAYSNFGSTATVFFVGSQAGLTAAGGNMFQAMAFGGSTSDVDYSTKGDLLIEGNPATVITPYVGGNGTGGDSVPMPAYNTPLVYDTTLNTVTGGSTTANLITNSGGAAAVNSSTGTVANPGYAFNTTQTIIGGRFNAGPFSGFDGSIGEVLVFNSVLSAADRAAVEQYLDAKWLGVGTASGNLPVNSPVQVGSGATLDLGGTVQQVPYVSNISGAGGVITNNVATPATLILAPASGSQTFSGSIQDGAGQVGITYNGAATATQILNGNNNFSGPTNVNAGVLTLGAGASLGNTAITVANGATLAVQTSSGSISANGSLTLLNGSTLDMTDGNTGVFNVGGPVKIGSAAGGGASLKFELSGSNSDEVVDSGSASVTGNNTIFIAALGTSLTTGQSYTLIQTAGGLAGSFTFPNGLLSESITVGSTVYNLALQNSSTTETLAVLAPGTTEAWNGSVSTVWGTASNWTPTVVPGTIGGNANADTVIFNASPANLSPAVNAAWNIQNITFDTASVGAINLTGTSGLTLSALGTTQTTSTVIQNEKISVPITLQGSYSFISNSANNNTLTLAGNITGGASSPINITLGGNTTGLNAITGVISDGSATPVSLTKAGSGTWALLNSNTYSGDTDINAGVLQIANGALGSNGNVVFNGGTLQYATGANQDFSNRINNSLSPVTIDTNGNNVNYAGGISSSNIAGLTKIGAGVLTLSNGNNYGGPTLVSGGGLNLANNSAVSGSTGITVNNGAALQLSAGVNIGSTALTLNGAGVTASPVGALESVSGLNTYSGNITLATNASVGADASAYLTVAGNVTSTGSTLTLTGPGSGTITGNIATGAGGVTQTSPGTWSLTGSNTYIGTTTISGGVLQISNDTNLGNSLAPVAINAATLEITSTHSSVRPFSLGGAASTIEVDAGQTYTMSGNIANGASAGTLNKTGAGTLVVAGTSTFSGGTNIASSTVVLGSPRGLGTGGITLTGTSPELQILPNAVGPIGFGYAAHTGWVFNTADANPGPSVSAGNVLTMTTAAGGERRTAYYTTPVPYTNFTASFTYQDVGKNGGDGIAFILQNSPAGVNAIGSNANSWNMAYAGGNVSNSAAIAWELYATAAGEGVAQGSNGTLANPFTPTNPAGLLQSGDPIAFTITGAASSNVLNLTMTDQATFGTFAGLSYSSSYTLANTLGNLIGGPTAYVGFGATTGGAYTVQTLSNFSYSNPFAGTFNGSNAVAVTTNSTIDVSYSGGAALGGLSIGNNTLTVTNASGGGGSLAMNGQTNLSGSPVLAVASQVQFALGSLNDGGSARSITLNGADSTSTLVLTGAATSFVSGSSIVVNTGTLLVANSTGSATGNGSISLAPGANFGGSGTVSTAVTIASGSSLLTGLSNDTVGKTAGTLTIGAGSNIQGSTLMDITGPLVSAELVISGSGAVVLGGQLTVTDPNTATYPLAGIQSFKLFNYAPGATRFSSVNLPSLPAGLTWNTSQLYTTGVISISGATPNNIVWDNSPSATGNGSTWDGSILPTSQNFNNSGTAANFTPGDNVTFSDANHGHYVVSVSGIVNPSSIVVNNSAGNYNFGGTGTITGSGGLTKVGSGTLTLSLSNSYTGGTTVNGGSLVLAVAGALPSGSNLTIGSGGAVVVNSLGVNATALTIGSLSVVGKLDLKNNDLILHSTPAASVFTALQTGYNAGWNGPAGIVSTTAAANPQHLTGVGMLVNDNGSGSPLYGSGGTLGSTFGGSVPVDGDVLVK